MTRGIVCGLPLATARLRSSRADYTPAALLDGGANTLYLCGTAHEQERLGSLLAAMLSELVGVVYELAAQTGKPLDPPLLLALDEAANTAAIPELHHRRDPPA